MQSKRRFSVSPANYALGVNRTPSSAPALGRLVTVLIRTHGANHSKKWTQQAAPYSRHTEEGFQRVIIAVFRRPEKFREPQPPPTHTQIPQLAQHNICSGLPRPQINMYTQRQPLLVEEDMALQELGAVEAGSLHASRHSDSGHSGFTSLAPLQPPTRDDPGLSQSSSRGNESSSTDYGAQSTTNFHLPPRALGRGTKKRSRAWFCLDVSLISLVCYFVGSGTYLLIDASLGNQSSVGAECNSQNARGVEQFFLVNLKVDCRVS